MLTCFTLDAAACAPTSIIPICQNEFSDWLENQVEQHKTRIQNITTANNFSAKPNTFCLITSESGQIECVLLGIKNNEDYLAFGVLPKILPNGTYCIKSLSFSQEQLNRAAIGWGMGSYKFTKYKTEHKKQETNFNNLLLDSNYDYNLVDSVVTNTFLTRDLINTPACDLHPEELAKISEIIAKEFNGEFKKISGEELKKDFPSVYAVGRGSKNRPLLIDMQFGDKNSNAPKIVLVGKGVCFDSGGLNLKKSDHMLTMKTDMAGAAHALSLTRMIMLAKLPVNLRVIIPAVENLISDDSAKPGDIIVTRKGLSIEVTNTDAEGRLILADALTLACEGKPNLILDFATLTGAARVALGNDIVALFTPNDDLAAKIISSMNEEREPVWRLPLYQPYFDEYFKSDIADFINCSVSDSPGGGAITAALILQQFVESNIKWAHFDIFAYNEKSRPGKPAGGEADCLKGVFNFIKNNIK